jgi:ribonucleotide monophosphatase NagD (HAD superfamily)
MPAAFLFDLDGTVYTDTGPIPGALDVLAELRHRGVPHAFVTNTTSRSRRLIAERLRGYGFLADASRIVTATVAGAELLKARGVRRVAAHVPDAALEDLAGFALTDERPEVVLVADLAEAWDFERMNRAFHQLMDGADLVALSRDRYWLHAAALEVLGPEFVRRAGEVMMVGDDIWGDIEGAQRAGLGTCLVKTGKYREEVFADAGIRPARVVASVADVAAFL